MKITVRHVHDFAPGLSGMLRGIADSLFLIHQQGRHLQMKFEDFVASQTAHNETMSAAIDGLTGDVTNLNTTIQTLKDQLATAGLTTEQQATLDALDAAGSALATRAANLDAQTPPEVPPAPPPADTGTGGQPSQ